MLRHIDGTNCREERWLEIEGDQALERFLELRPSQFY
jgi:hypothetical protein